MPCGTWSPENDKIHLLARHKNVTKIDRLILSDRQRDREAERQRGREAESENLTEDLTTDRLND